MDQVTNNNGIRREVTRGGITLDEIRTGEFQKPGTLTAQIRQIVTTKAFYPEKKVASNLQDTLFSNEEFGFSAQEFTSTEERVAWIFVPEKATKEEVMARIANAQPHGACIYRVLSSQPVLDENQQYSITSGLRTLDFFADKYAVRYPENEKTLADGTAGKLTLDKDGNVQYRRTFFSLTKREDIDTRGEGEVYLTAQLKAEIAGASVLSGQTIQ